MPQAIDITGQRFGMLVALHRAHRGSRKSTHACWHCVCDCGNTKIAAVGNLKAGFTQSCGCLFKTVTRALRMTHGESAKGRVSVEYSTWRCMLTRCTNPKVASYKNYGGRGIKVCDRWANSFENFLADMGRRPSAQNSLDRFPNNDGDYEHGNCRWATRTEQGLNTRRSRKDR